MTEHPAEKVLRELVRANRERRMALKTRDQGLITAAEARLARSWKAAHACIGNIPNPETPADAASAEAVHERYAFVLAACRDAQGIASRYGWALHDIAQGTADPTCRARAALLGSTEAPASPPMDRTGEIGKA